MKENNTVSIVTKIMGIFGCTVLFCAGLIAQESPASSTGPQEATAVAGGSDTTVSSSKPQITGDSEYDVKSSFEIGVRGLDVNGNINKYRSDLNYKSGVRFFDSSVLVTTQDADKPFDTFLFTSTGWNADPNGYTRFDLEKTGWYEFSSQIRRFRYFNNLTNFALNQHNRNTEHKMGDFDITILPQRDLSFRAGYSFDRNSGPQWVTYDFSRDEFPVDSRYKTSGDDVRLGVDGSLAGVNLSFTQGYRRFRDNTTFSIDFLELGNNPNPNSSIATLTRDLPTRGRTHYSRFSFQKTFAKTVDIAGRAIYSDTQTDFTVNQVLTGTDRFGNTIISDQFTSAGDASKPIFFGDIGMTVFVTDNFRLSNTFGFNQYRITGGQLFNETVMSVDPGGVPLPPAIDDELVYRFTRYKRYINTLVADADVNRFISFYLGYRYTDRTVDLTGFDRDIRAMSTSSFTETATNDTHSLLAGLKAKPVPRRWTVYFDFVHGQSDNAFTRASNYDLTHVRLRNKFSPTDNLSFSIAVETKDNDNPSRPDASVPQQLGASSSARIFSGSFSWAPNDNATVNGGYVYNRLTVESDIRFPSFGPANVGTSRYLLRSNFGYFDAWVKPHPRFSIFGAYRITKDTGSGNLFSASSPALIVGNYPIEFQSPEVRGIIRITDNIDWNLGYQYYSYGEKLNTTQDYRAHLPYTSIRFYFGGAKDR